MSSSIALWVAVVFIAVGILGLLLMLIAASAPATGVARSLELLQGRVTNVREVGRNELSAYDRLVVPTLDGFRGLGRRLSPAGTADKLDRLLDRAGNPGNWSVERVLGAKGVGLVLGAVGGLAYGGLNLKGLFWAVIAGSALFWLPDLLVYNAALKRQDQIRKGLADALDMLTVCVEAGLGFDAALLQVARSVKGPIAGEFARALSEIQIGKSRGEAFSSMGERTTAAEVKNFVSALVQADRLGLPIGAVLREQSTNMRLVRRQRAEEKAQKVTVKILFPLLLCIFPALFIVIIGPGAIRIYEVFVNGVMSGK
jgi:tight adherence protein C